MPNKVFSQNRIACDAPIQCNGWLYHVNKIGHGYQPTASGWQITGDYNYGGIRFGGNGIRFVSGVPDDGTPKEVAIITNEGNVGIGITQPLEKLHVNGNTVINGNIGIGNVSPLNAIDILGNSIESSQMLIKNSFSNNSYPYSIVKFGTANGKSYIEGNKDFIISIDNQGNYADESFKIVNNISNVSMNDINNHVLFSLSNYDAQLFKTLYVYDFAGNAGRINVKIDNTNGHITCRKLIIKVSESIGDFVFDNGYEIPSLYEEEKYYKTYKHLKGIPSENQIMREGMDVDRFIASLLQKLETTVIQNVQQQKEIDFLKQEIKDLKIKISK